MTYFASTRCLQWKKQTHKRGVPKATAKGLPCQKVICVETKQQWKCINRSSASKQCSTKKQTWNTAVKNKQEFSWDAHFLVALSCKSKKVSFSRDGSTATSWTLQLLPQKNAKPSITVHKYIFCTCMNPFGPTSTFSVSLTVFFKVKDPKSFLFALEKMDPRCTENSWEWLCAYVTKQPAAQVTECQGNGHVGTGSDKAIP